ncbi:protein kinase [Streptomyces sp. DH8]|uniref:protein kinase domain-containing protein n=1 Tax=Streptomyces sp. DH8 TaxID=2857008 RepID=UPI0027DF1347|nr:protein kinase [Streptomyces sp. DH8]
MESLNPQGQRLVMNRRGTTLWEVRTPGKIFAVKVGYPTETHAWTALAPGREIAVLRQLTPEAHFSGAWERGTWGAQPWRSGVSLYERWEHHRAEKAPQPDMQEALSCASALAELHRKRWVHGDIQPAHLIIGRAGTFLIDLALAQGGRVPDDLDFSYQGCLVHYEAPEIARSVLQTGFAIPTRESDVYALGASLMISATGKRHVAYPDDADRRDQRQAIADGPNRTVEIPGDLGRLVSAMMNRRPAERPTATEVCRELSRAL